MGGKVGEVQAWGSEGGGGKGDVEVREEGGTTSVYPSKGEQQVELEGKKRYDSIFSEKKLWDWEGKKN